MYELEDRTLRFSKQIIGLCNKLPKTTVSTELIKQLCRSGTSVGANYREANEALGRKDFKYRINVARKEAKESTYWLELIQEAYPERIRDIEFLIQETKELRCIFSAILAKSL